MKFLIIVAALFAERYLLDQENFRQHRWFADYSRWFRGLGFTPWLSTHRVGILALLAPPVLVVALLQWALAGVWGGLLSFLFAGLMLLLSLGPKDLDRQVSDYLDARDHGSQDRAQRIASELAGRNIEEPEPARSLIVSEAIVEQANYRIFAVLFWFVLLGAFGAFLYRLAHLAGAQRSDEETGQQLRQRAMALLYILDWLPVRITAATYALVGNFDNVLLAWRHWQQERHTEFETEASGLLVSTGTAALSHGAVHSMPDDPDDLPPLVEDALSLVLRTMTLCVFMLGLITLVFWIA